MKKWFRALVCTAALALMLCTGAMAADSTVHVQLNGRPLALSEAPQILDGHTYLPFRAVFTALGFADKDIAYQADTRQLSVSSSRLTLTAVLGENRFTVVRDGESSVIETDAAAFLDSDLNRAYVPARFVAEAAGCRLGWNGETSTVILDNVDAILAANQEKYTVLDQYLDFNRQFMSKNYQVNGNYAAALSLTGSLDGGADRMDMKGQYSMLMAGGSTFDFDMGLRFSGKIDGQDLSALMPGGLDLALRGSLDGGTFYFKSNALMSSAGMGVENLWFKLDLGQIFDRVGAEEGMTYAQLIALSRQVQEMNGREYVEYLVRITAQADPSQSVQYYLDLVNSLAGDSAFTKNGASYVSSYEMDGGSLAVTLTTSAGKVSGYRITADFTQEDRVLAMDVSQTGDQMKAALELRSEEIAMKMEMDGEYAVTTSVPAGAPPKEAAVLDLGQDLLNEL